MQNINWDYYYQITEEKLKELNITELEVDKSCRAFSIDTVCVYLKSFDESKVPNIVDIMIKLDNENIIIDRIKRDESFWVYIYFKYEL